MKFFSYLIVAIASFVAAFLLLNSGDAPSYDFSDIPSFEQQPEESTSFSSYYNQLTDYQKKIYDALLTPISNAEDEIEFSNVNITDFDKNCFKVTVAIQYDHPEYFWFTGGYSYKYSRVRFEETGDIVFTPTYYTYVSPFFDETSKLQKLQSVVENVADLARNHSNDDFERIMFVHDYLVENAYYDNEALDEYYKTSHSPSCEYIFSAYGCLVEGKTVCSGYAKAFQLIMQELGYDCSYVTGDAGEAHGWNCIYLDGEGYYIDVTWDDFDLQKEAPLYNYAFITDAALSKTHTIDMMFDAPVCNATTYNYFRHMEYFTEVYDFDTASAILSQQSANDAVHIQFGSLEELGNAYDELLEKSFYKKIPGLENFSQNYFNEDHYTLTLMR